MILRARLTYDMVVAIVAVVAACYGLAVVIVNDLSGWVDVAGGVLLWRWSEKDGHRTHTRIRQRETGRRW